MVLPGWVSAPRLCLAGLCDGTHDRGVCQNTVKLPIPRTQTFMRISRLRHTHGNHAMHCVRNMSSAQRSAAQLRYSAGFLVATKYPTNHIPIPAVQRTKSLGSLHLCRNKITFCKVGSISYSSFFFPPFRGFFPPAVLTVPVHGAQGATRGVSCHRASAKSSCKGGSGPPARLSWPGRNSRRDAAKARSPSTAKMPLHRKTHAASAAARRGAGTAAARAQASSRTNVVASGIFRGPPSSDLNLENH